MTGFQRPEDGDIRTAADGHEIFYFTTTTTSQIFSFDLTNPDHPVSKVFADQSTIDAATGLPLGSSFLEPDNITSDLAGITGRKGNLCFTEDIGGTNPVDDLFCAIDANDDGVAEALGRFAILTTSGAEPTGILFNPTNPGEFLVDVQHSANFQDRLISITLAPEPATLALFSASLAGLAATRCRR